MSMELLNPSLIKLPNEQRLSGSLKYIEHQKRELKKNAMPIVTFDILDEGENYIVYAKKFRKYAYSKSEVSAKLALNGLLFEGICTNNSPTAKFTSWESTATVDWVRELIKINQQAPKPDQP